MNISVFLKRIQTFRRSLLKKIKLEIENSSPFLIILMDSSHWYKLDKLELWNVTLL